MEKLTEKISLRQHIKNIKNLYKIINEIDKNYFKISMITHIANVAAVYIALWLSSYVLDGLAQKKGARELSEVTVITLVIIFLIRFVASTVWNYAEARRDRIYNIYSSNIEMKILDMDYSEIDSPKVKGLRDKIDKDTNWGWGINTPVFITNSILFDIVNIFASIVLAYPIVKIVSHTGRYSVLFSFVMIILIAIVTDKLRLHYNKMLKEYQFFEVDEKDREEMVNFAYDFIYGREYTYANTKDIKIYNGYDLLKRYTIEPFFSKKHRELDNKGVFSMGMEAAMGDFTMGVVEAGAYLVVILAALSGKISAGNVVVFVGSLQKLLTGVTHICTALVALAFEAKKQISTLELIGLKDEMYKGKLPVEKRSDNEYKIEFKNVYFKYPGSDEYALKNFSMELNIGEKLAIVGMNGSGKTTMIKLLCRLYDVEKGEILLNGVDIRKFDQREYRRLFSVVFQDFNILPFTLKQNVAADMEGDNEKIEDCLEKAGLKTRLDKLDNGLDTYIGKSYDESGVEFSGGEMQKIAIARAIYKEAPFVLLDEPTAALDPIAEYEIYSNFDRMVKDKTAIYISHRLSSCRFCKNIAVFDEGEIVQFGTHEELLNDTDGKYYEFWNAQAQYYI